jgi:hypothetical protein
MCPMCNTAYQRCGRAIRGSAPLGVEYKLNPTALLLIGSIRLFGVLSSMAR